MTSDEIFRDIFSCLDAHTTSLARIEAALTARPTAAAPASRPATGSAGGTGGEVATDADLDGKYGNEPVRKDPPKWIKDGGASYVGRRLSECPAEYLDAVASFADWRRGKDEQKGDEQGMKNAGYAARDAARARGHAARIRAGKTTTPAPVQATDDDSSIPF